MVDRIKWGLKVQLGRRVWGRMDTCICMVESLCYSPKTISTLFVNWLYSNTKQKVFFFKVKLGGLPWWSSGWDSVLPMHGAQVQTLVRELIPHAMAEGTPQLRVQKRSCKPQGRSKILRATTKTQGSQINKYCFEKCSWKMEKGLVVGSEETELPAADRTRIG